MDVLSAHSLILVMMLDDGHYDGQRRLPRGGGRGMDVRGIV